MARLTIPAVELMRSGHSACPGCGATLVMRYLLKGLGERTVVTVPACCWTVIGTPFPTTALDVPMLDCAFEATGASISGLRAAADVMGLEDVTIVGFAGDGGTADIGLQALSGMLERRTDGIYVMYDNEAYMNTGVQRSGATPEGAWTTTTPVDLQRSTSRTPCLPIRRARRPWVARRFAGSMNRWWRRCRGLSRRNLFPRSVRVIWHSPRRGGAMGRGSASRWHAVTRMAPGSGSSTGRNRRRHNH